MKIILTICMLAATFSCFAQPLNYPVPPIEPGHMFYMQNSKNTNTVVYEATNKTGVPDLEKPLHPFWIRYGEKGQREELTGIQRKFAYGLTVVQLADKSFELNFAANKKYKIYFQKAEDGVYHVYTTINKKRAILTHIFINIIGGTPWAPKVDHVEISGLDAITKDTISEKVPMN